RMIPQGQLRFAAGRVLSSIETRRKACVILSKAAQLVDLVLRKQATRDDEAVAMVREELFLTQTGQCCAHRFPPLLPLRPTASHIIAQGRRASRRTLGTRTYQHSKPQRGFTSAPTPYRVQLPPSIIPLKLTE